LLVYKQLSPFRFPLLEVGFSSALGDIPSTNQSGLPSKW